MWHQKLQTFFLLQKKGKKRKRKNRKKEQKEKKKTKKEGRKIGELKLGTTLGYLLATLSKNILGCRCLETTNTLAYYSKVLLEFCDCGNKLKFNVVGFIQIGDKLFLSFFLSQTLSLYLSLFLLLSFSLKHFPLSLSL
jgi:hypothetical protein